MSNLNNLNNLNRLNYFSKQPTDSIYYAGTGASLDLNFAGNKSLMDRISGNNLVTFTRASGGTYFDSTRTLRNATTNLLLRSEEFDNASWLKLNSVTVAANAITAPNGAITADKIIEPASSADKPVVQAVTLAASTTYTASVYIKAAERQTILFHVRKNDYSTRFGGFFNTSTNIFTAETSAGGVLNSFIFSDVGGGWYRCSITGNIGSNTAGIVTIYIANSNNTLGYAGDGISGIYLWGAQLEAGAFPTSYIPTTSTINSAPRFDHNPATGESLGLLIEEQRTNSIRNNTMQGAVAGTPGTLPTNWAIGGAGIGTLTQQIVAVGTIGALSYIDIRYSGTTSTTNFRINFEPNTQVAALSGQSWTNSLYTAIIAGSATNVASVVQGVTERSSGGGFLDESASAVNTTAELIRTQVTRVFNQATTAFCNSFVAFNFNSGVTIDITLRIGLPQLEQGAFATSVIPTSGTVATRAADIASISGSNFSSWYNQSEGTMFCGFARAALIGSSSFANLFAVSNNTANERILVYNTGSTQTIDAVVTNAGIGQATLLAPGSITANSKQQFAISYRVDDFAAVRNAGAAAVDNSGSLPTVDRLYIGSNHIGGGQFSGHIQRLTYFPQRISNANLQRITQ